MMLQQPPLLRSLGLRSSALAAVVLALSLSSCGHLQELGSVRGGYAQGSWLALDDAHRHTVSPGVFLNLPDAPYRAKFADERGVYYQASRALRFSTQDGAVIEVDGGLYMLHDNPLQATTWFYPTLGAPATPYKTPLKVTFFSAKY
ncbi:hypothetical protein [Limnohabitans sp. 2KL-3]|uniref:hypothetical protein n=1 Tax=Limnohabitans sp. 2KL-3 TaxID=1100700 RepID=UPI000A55FBE5|nr:hypothetical protein [Limnohabitans sp. 2KL-3]